MKLLPTPSQTVGPFFSIGLGWLERIDLAGETVTGERVTIHGRVLDGDGVPVPDAVLEIWQANRYGRYAHHEDTQKKPVEKGFAGFGRVATNGEGLFQFSTIKPGPVPGPNGTEQAPHLVISVFMRGLLKRLVTRMYFPNDARHANDPILTLVDAARKGTLIATADDASCSLEWNVVLQGPRETVFFDLGL